MTTICHLHIFEHFIDTFFDLRFGEVPGQAHPGGVGEGVLHRQIAVDYVILRYVAQLSAKSGQVAVVVSPIIVHLTLLGGTQAVEGIQQGRFA